MFAIAERAQADIVLGKVVSNGRRVPHHLFARDVESTSIAELPLENSLTPHKMFRRSMLLEHDILFPVTKRLEDQPFVLRSYFAARNVAIVGSYPCYHFTKRDDGANLSYSYLDPVLYYENLRAIIDIVEEGTEPGPLRDRILRRSYRSEIIGRVSEPGFLELTEEDRHDLVHHARLVADERFPPAVVAGLRPITRIRADLLRLGDERGLTDFRGSHDRDRGLGPGQRSFLERQCIEVRRAGRPGHRRRIAAGVPGGRRQALSRSPDRTSDAGTRPAVARRADRGRETPPLRHLPHRTRTIRRMGTVIDVPGRTRRTRRARRSA